MKESTETVKVVLLGESGVGKTSIISQFTSGVFDSNVVTSITAQFISKTIEFKDLKKSIRFDIWDTAGQEKFRSLAKIFYKDAKIIILVYDITCKKNFTELKDYWYEKQTKLHADSDPIFAVVANKSDLYANQEVDDEEGKKFAESINGIFQSTSAKSDTGITDLFKNLGYRYFNPNYDVNAIEKEKKQAYEKKKKAKNDDDEVEERKKRVKLENVQKTNSKKNGCC